MSSPASSSDDQYSEPPTWHPLLQPPPPIPFTGERSRFGIPPPTTSTTRVGRSSRPETIPSSTNVARGSWTTVAPMNQLRTGMIPGGATSLRTLEHRSGTYGVPRRPTTHGAALRMLQPLQTPNTPLGLGTPETKRELLLRMSRTPPVPSPGTTSTSRANRSMPPLDTSSSRHSRPLGLGLGFRHPATTATTLLPLFGETRYPSCRVEGATSRQSRTDSGQTSPTPVTAPQSPIEEDDDSEVPTPLVLGSRNPFLTSIITTTRTPLTGRGPTGSGTPSNKSTGTFSVPKAPKPGNFDAPTSKPEPAGITPGPARTWNISSPRTEGRRFILGLPPTEKSWPESTPTTTGSYTRLTQALDAPTFEHEHRRRSPFSEDNSRSSRSSSMSDSRGNADLRYEWDART